MRGWGLLGAVAALAMAFAANSVCAQTATSAQVGKPLALLAGLRPPHEAKRKEAKHTIHAKAAHERTATKTHRRRLAAHARHASATRLATRHHAHHEQAITASAFAEEPSPQMPATSAPVSGWPAASQNPAPTGHAATSDPAAAPVADNAPPNAAAGNFRNPDASRVQTVKITAPDPTSLPNPANGHGASDAAAANDSAAAVPAAAATPQTLAAAPVAEPNKDRTGQTTDAVGSASWIAQVLAALGGAVAAGAVAWFLIGGGPVRTYG